MPPASHPAPTGARQAPSDERGLVIEPLEPERVTLSVTAEQRAVSEAEFQVIGDEDATSLLESHVGEGERRSVDGVDIEDTEWSLGGSVSSEPLQVESFWAAEPLRPDEPTRGAASDAPLEPPDGFDAFDVRDDIAAPAHGDAAPADAAPGDDGLADQRAPSFGGAVGGDDATEPPSGDAAGRSWGTWLAAGWSVAASGDRDTGPEAGAPREAADALEDTGLPGAADVRFGTTHDPETFPAEGEPDVGRAHGPSGAYGVGADTTSERVPATEEAYEPTAAWRPEPAPEIDERPGALAWLHEEVPAPAPAPEPATPSRGDELTAALDWPDVDELANYSVLDAPNAAEDGAALAAVEPELCDSAAPWAEENPAPTVAEALERIARQIRDGAVVLPADVPAESDAGALAVALAALLRGRTR